MRRNGGTIGNRAWGAAAAAGLAVFIWIQVFPMAWSFFADHSRILGRDAASRAALAALQERFGLTGSRSDMVLTHMSNSAAVGYFSKEKLSGAYDQRWADDHPTDFYRAEIPLPGGEGTLTLLLHMETGKLVGWRDSRRADGAAAAEERHEDAGQQARRALQYAAAWGEPPEKWEWDGAAADDAGRYTFNARDGKIGEALLQLKVRAPEGYDPASSAWPPWAYGSVEYEVRIPDAFISYMAEQEQLAGRMSALGFILPQLVLIVLAVAYAASLRSFASFRRGLILAAVFLVLYAVYYWNMVPGFQSGLLEDGEKAHGRALEAVMTVNFIILACQAAFTYFSAVAGDGLWRSMGRPLWPRWQDPAFGETVFSGMKKGYMLAFILLGAQSAILLGLESGIGMFQSSDAAQSSANMLLPGLLILLAWCAGISEELQSRLFGIGLFRKWFTGGAERLLGRPLSRRADSALTALAMLPPGLIWAFGHVGYAVYPAYSRLIELIIMALLFGWFMLRFGFIAVLFAHVVLNSMLMGAQMLFDGLPGDSAFGLAGLVLPAAAAYLILLAHRRWGPGSPARNS